MGSFWRMGAVLLAGLATGCDTESTRRCRSHATSYLASGPGITQGYPNIQTPIRVDCEFDKDLLDRTCTARYQDQFSSPAEHTVTARYASVADFVEEATPPGRVLAITVTVRHEGVDSGTIVAPYLHAAVSGETDYVYNSQKRPISHGFDSWDQAGRPLSAAPTGICTADTGTRLTYDDTARTVTVTYNTRLSPRPDGTIPCGIGQARWTFDAQGNPIQYQGSSSSEGTSYSVQDVEEVCVTESD
jgi:hypothetical protein